MSLFISIVDLAFRIWLYAWVVVSAYGRDWALCSACIGLLILSALGNVVERMKP